MKTIKELYEQRIEEKITDLIKNRKYSSISDLKKSNPSLRLFCMQNDFQCIFRSFLSQFTELDYLNLLDKLDNKKQVKENSVNEIKKTSIGNQTFVDINPNNKLSSDNNPTLVGLESTSNNIHDESDFMSAQKFDIPTASFVNKKDVKAENLTQEELNTFQKIQNATNDDDNISIFRDDNAKLTTTVKDESGNYSTVDEISGEDQLIGQESSKSQGIAKQKVLTTSSRKPTNISAAFTNTLILSFIIGSFFGVVFLAIYLKVMH